MAPKPKDGNIDICFSINPIKIAGILLIILICCLFLCGVYGICVVIDSEQDIKTCKLGMKSTTQERVQCFANDDFSKINFGKDINCTCFYWEGQNFKSKTFEID